VCELAVRPSREAIEEEIRFMNESKQNLINTRAPSKKKMSAIRPPKDVETLESSGAIALGWGKTGGGETPDRKCSGVSPEGLKR